MSTHKLLKELQDVVNKPVAICDPELIKEHLDEVRQMTSECVKQSTAEHVKRTRDTYKLIYFLKANKIITPYLTPEKALEARTNFLFYNKSKKATISLRPIEEVSDKTLEECD